MGFAKVFNYKFLSIYNKLKHEKDSSSEKFRSPGITNPIEIKYFKEERMEILFPVN